MKRSSSVHYKKIVSDYSDVGSRAITLSPGTHVLECWGAQGGYSSGGKGGYAKGTLVLDSTTTAYIYVGGKGNYTTSGASSGGFNGGGNAYSIGAYYSGSGGGASDIRLGTDSLSARVIVAGGGGGAGRYDATQGWQAGGYGGGSSGGAGKTYDSSSAGGAMAGGGGTQYSRGTSYYGTNSNSTTYGTLAGFGVGGGAISGNTSYRTVGGGGGWYGGGYSQRAGAGGGSGYVLTSSSSKPSGYLLGSDSYLSDAQTKAGNTSFPSTSGSTETGHSGNGYVRITSIIPVYSVTLSTTNCSAQLSTNETYEGDTIVVSGLSAVSSSYGFSSVSVYTESGSQVPYAMTGSSDNDYEITFAMPGEGVTVNLVYIEITDISSATVTAANQTYSGSALTPAPTVTLNGSTVPSSGYDVSYSNNTNAGTATVTVVGKGVYAGTASGTFTIAKADPVITDYPTNAGATYNGTEQSLLTGGTTDVAGSFSYSTGTNAGSYTGTWWFTPTDTSNYNSLSGTVAATIAKASRTVSFSSPKTSVEVGSTVTNVATVSDGASDGTLTYSSSNTSYATVDGSGVVTGVAEGSVTITATMSEGMNYLSASASYTMEVAYLTIEFIHTGSAQQTTLNPGTYKLECWGAQGGSVDSTSGGLGGYSVGEMTLSEATTLYIYVGGKGTDGDSLSSSGLTSGGFNGGGNGYSEVTYWDKNYGSGGGGASDIRIGGSELSYRIIVAGGGGGTGSYSSGRYAGGYGGGYSGGTGTQYTSSNRAGTGGSYSSRGTSYRGTTADSSSYGILASLGTGGGAKSNGNEARSGGGGGWYGGGYARYSGAGGGSGYVNTSGTYALSNASTSAGSTSFPSTSGGTETGHSGDGFVRITKL